MLQRDVYYTLKHLFESQDACDEIVYLLGKLMKKKRRKLWLDLDFYVISRILNYQPCT